MDAQQIAERHIVERYLAHRLTDDEAEAFEAYVEVHPEIIRDVEEVARMKAGLATLKERGELPVSAKARAWYWHPAVMAASLAGVLITALLLNPWKTRELATMASTFLEVAGEDLTPEVRVAVVTLARTRGAMPQSLSLVPGQAAVEVKLELMQPEAQVYSVRLMRLNNGELIPVAEIGGLRPDGDGTLTLFVRLDALEKSDYLFRVRSSAGETDRDFAVRLK